LIICGYPNVGKSSFINKITRADVDVQPVSHDVAQRAIVSCEKDRRRLTRVIARVPSMLSLPSRCSWDTWTTDTCDGR
jgi:GTPase Era involved in 16S rRNA processing